MKKKLSLPMLKFEKSKISEWKVSAEYEDIYEQLMGFIKKWKNGLQGKTQTVTLWSSVLISRPMMAVDIYELDSPCPHWKYKYKMKYSNIKIFGFKTLKWQH